MSLLVLALQFSSWMFCATREVAHLVLNVKQLLAVSVDLLRNAGSFIEIALRISITEIEQVINGLARKIEHGEKTGIDLR